MKLRSLTHSEMVKAITDDGGHPVYVTESGEVNFSDNYCTAKMCMRLQSEGHLVFDKDYFIRPDYT